MRTKLTNWYTSTYSNGGGGACVEVGSAPDLVGIRDSKNRDGGVLIVDHRSFTRFITAIKSERY
ncbi:DUF397 domain-containing protein [Actinoalloteichus sp. AHMU CJ021]|uniref:DUF397 domain-containing protein n=1 Tax=Actinoalloteichus caeruleus DSM 43889 TaxID=1120930 RepID=A0ABT1JGE5_ACTCY|nr:DUF397 domain-containing protein [Actinoalloteichus caeruleus]AUS77428.1 DUF397 domain-containing protein [Actinoalloteichus sp. AHMU CJ021]MCP2331259.1 protein of unknown function (DUF397) [Actinoalloteichus caeruleus DSM 43889]